MREKIKMKVTKKMGRGMFATQSIKKGEYIHYAEIVTLKWSEMKNIKTLNQYTFYYDQKYVALALGYGSLFNHSFNNNLKTWMVEKGNRWVIAFQATRPIKKGEQLFIYYGDDITDWLK
jgi:SET domain-containing protein